jgi:hypothetical protein
LEEMACDMAGMPASGSKRVRRAMVRARRQAMLRVGPVKQVVDLAGMILRRAEGMDGWLRVIVPWRLGGRCGSALLWIPVSIDNEPTSTSQVI